MPYIKKVFDRTVNKKCFVRETELFRKQLNCCEVRKMDDDDDDSDDYDGGRGGGGDGDDNNSYNEPTDHDSRNCERRSRDCDHTKGFRAVKTPHAF